MHSKLMAASLAAALCGVGAASANAASIAILLTDPSVNGGAQTLVAGPGPSTTPLTLANYTYGSFMIAAVSGAASGAGTIYFGSTSLLLQSAVAGMLTIDVIEQGVTSPVGDLHFT